MTDTAWHDFQNRHRIGGSLGFPENPGLCTPGIGGNAETKPGWKKGLSGVPASSDHSHPLEAVRMTLVTAEYQTGAQHAAQNWYPWGNPWFTFPYTLKDEACRLAFQYMTTFWVQQHPAAALFGVQYNGTTYFNDHLIHYKNTVADHCMASGIVEIPAAVLPLEHEVILTFMWFNHSGGGTLTTDGNDFAQINIMEYYST